MAMEQRRLGRTGREVGVVGLGTWQLGGDWGDAVGEQEALATLRAALDAGVDFLDTADVYGDGRSEQLIGEFLKESGDSRPAVATKMGRRGDNSPESYSPESFRDWNDRSRQNLGVETLDLVQLHSSPSAVVSSDAVYDALDELVEEGRVAAYGVSVETSEQALTAIARPNLASVQIILNAFRQKPLDEVLPAALEAGVGIIARVPLASGLLSGKYDEHTTFAENDHRNFNRRGEEFDVGETFAGVDFETGVRAARGFSELAPEGATPAQLALRWVIDQPGVSTVIPGARSAEQARANAAAAELAPLSNEALVAIRELYDEELRPLVHDRW
jgi:aryl-alcohol dehydrogenase-like predicted oxidoreductase